MKNIIIILVVTLIGLEGIGWFFYQKSKENKDQVISEKVGDTSQPIKANPNVDENSDIEVNESLLVAGNEFDSDSFPSPTVETIDGIVQRTIHMGVRQWAWDPSEILVNFGEKVILIMHNADVRHSISIPDLNVRQEIPEEGAVVIFIADKRGTFEFSCDTPCGEGHTKMKGRITIA